MLSLVTGTAQGQSILLTQIGPGFYPSTQREKSRSSNLLLNLIQFLFVTCFLNCVKWPVLTRKWPQEAYLSFSSWASLYRRWPSFLFCQTLSVSVLHRRKRTSFAPRQKGMRQWRWSPLENECLNLERPGYEPLLMAPDLLYALPVRSLTCGGSLC